MSLPSDDLEPAPPSAGAATLGLQRFNLTMLWVREVQRSFRKGLGLLPSLIVHYPVPVADSLNMLDAGKSGFIRRICRTSAKDYRVDFEDLHPGILRSITADIDRSRHHYIRANSSRKFLKLFPMGRAKSSSIPTKGTETTGIRGLRVSKANASPPPSEPKINNPGILSSA